MCAFCTEFARPVADTNIITERQGWVVLPTIGAFTPGYCLLMPRRHIDAAADTATDELAGVAEFAEEMRATIARIYRTPVVLAEHGPRGCDVGAGCCSHAHLHLIPVPDPGTVAAAYAVTGGPGATLERLADLPATVTGSYLYLSNAPGDHRLWPSSGFARQFVRRVCAAQHDHADRWDWRDHPFEEHRRVTYATLTNILAPARGER